MAAGTYKNGVAIVVVYQAVNNATGKTVKMDIYDEAHALDAGKSVAAMTEVVATGRYYATFTPDAEGEWVAIMYNTTDSNGEVVKAFAVAGHDVDSIGDAVAVIDGEIEAIDTVVDAIKAVTDVESGVKAAVATIDGEIETIDTEIGVIDGLHDVPAEDGAPDATIRDVVGKKTDTVAGTSIVALAKQVLADTGSTGSIRGADDDTLKSLSDQIDAVSAPAMVG